MISLHVTNKDTDIRANLLLVWQHCIAGQFKDKDVVVNIHSSATPLVKSQGQTFGRMNPPFSLKFFTSKRQRTNSE
jgi:hypothetical protein